MPSTIAVIGASPDRKKFGNKCIRAYVRAGYTVFPVHPSATIVEGLSVFRTVADIPVDRLDRVSVYLPPAIGAAAMADVAKKPVDEVWLNPGADAPEVVAAAEKLGLTIICACSITGHWAFSREMFPDE